MGINADLSGPVAFDVLLGDFTLAQKLQNLQRPGPPGPLEEEVVGKTPREAVALYRELTCHSSYTLTVKWSGKLSSQPPPTHTVAPYSLFAWLHPMSQGCY